MPIVYTEVEADTLSGRNADARGQNGEKVIVKGTHEAIKDHGWEMVKSVASRKYDNGEFTLEGGSALVHVQSEDCK